ncbi:MBL fold metallo-hydrolase [Parvibaculum sp.]|uniref:MBL fold metallo-hydrolase n=1 Tax=Parvibaculum sp. TaxID=2024848 RepID=UPI000C954CC2|nr:MBL fold metallo-hydrolase [Parvibaculum sp.]MAB14340.1 MBL fold metallo-hydrolase [Parvibaculum sp.]
MCHVVGQAIERAIERRQFLAGLGAASTLVLGSPASAKEMEEQRKRINASQAEASQFNTRLILLGTAGGPVFWPGTNRHGIASAVAVGDALYLVDCGAGAGRRLQEAQGPSTNGIGVLRDVRALFFTHLHSDHIVDYPALTLFGIFDGSHAKVPLKVFGPGRRNEMEPVFSPAGAAPHDLPVVNPENPTPGTKDMAGYLYQAFATDINDRIRDNHRPDPSTMIDVHDIELPEIPGFESPNKTPEPEMAPFKVFEDDRVRVSATLVNHFPVWPAFAFRFDTDDGSIVFSGDTAVSENLIRLAKGADILVHEVIVADWVRSMFPQPRSENDDAILNHLLSAHTAVEDVGTVAARAEVSTLVLSHIVPGNASNEDLAPAQKGFEGKLVIGEDLMQLGVGRR